MSSGQTILVTGGSGYVGTLVCKLLANAGHNVINIDRRKKDQEGVTQYPFDISNHQVDGVIQLMRPDTVVHLANKSNVKESIENPGLYYENNVSNTIQLLNSCAKAGVKNFVFVSSTASVSANNPYAKSKHFIEQILPDYNLNYVVLRMSHIAGASADAKHGLLKDASTQLVADMVHHAIYDETFTVHNAGTVRDFVHVEDAAQAVVSAVGYLDGDVSVRTFDIGSGTVSSVLDVAKEISAHGVTLNVNVIEDTPCTQSSCDIQEAAAHLGYTPKYSLADIVTHTIAWEKKHKRKK